MPNNSNFNPRDIQQNYAQQHWANFTPNRNFGSIMLNILQHTPQYQAFQLLTGQGGHQFGHGPIGNFIRNNFGGGQQQQDQMAPPMSGGGNKNTAAPPPTIFPPNVVPPIDPSGNGGGNGLSFRVNPTVSSHNPNLSYGSVGAVGRSNGGNMDRGGSFGDRSTQGHGKNPTTDVTPPTYTG